MKPSPRQQNASKLIPSKWSRYVETSLNLETTTRGDGGTETSCLKGPWGSAPEPYTHTKDLTDITGGARVFR